MNSACSYLASGLTGFMMEMVQHIHQSVVHKKELWFDFGCWQNHTYRCIKLPRRIGSQANWSRSSSRSWQVIDVDRGREAPIKGVSLDPETNMQLNACIRPMNFVHSMCHHPSGSVFVSKLIPPGTPATACMLPPQSIPNHALASSCSRCYYPESQFLLLYCSIMSSTPANYHLDISWNISISVAVLDVTPWSNSDVGRFGQGMLVQHILTLWKRMCEKECHCGVTKSIMLKGGQTKIHTVENVAKDNQDGPLK